MPLTCFFHSDPHAYSTPSSGPGHTYNKGEFTPPIHLHPVWAKQQYKFAHLHCKQTKIMFFLSFYANNAYVCSWTLMALGLCVFKHRAPKLFNSFQSIWLKFLSNLKPQPFWEHLEIILCHHLNKYLSFISLDNKLKKVMCVFYDAWSSGWEETTRPISRV